jgi:exopolysaccharide biosynthesis polyprenyl glycosylphosphotransferase
MNSGRARLLTLSLLLADAVGTGCGVLVAAVTPGPVPFLATAGLVGLVAIIGARSLARRFVRSLPARLVVVGGDRGEVARIASRIDANADWGLSVVGIATDGTWTAASEDRWPMVGDVADLPAVSRRQVVDEVILAPTPGRPDQLAALEETVLALAEQGVAARVLLNFLSSSVADISLERVGPLSFLTFSTAPRGDALLGLRRLGDVLVAGALLVVLAPLFGLIAAAIKLGSGGPVLFRQTRCGLGGRPFTFLKFRSMRVDADQLKPVLAPYNEMGGPAFKMTNDPRVTPLGRWLRRTSLDELPQLWNILRGDMSFVGPRPAVVEEVALYTPWQRRRLSMPPGLTCLWQVSGRSQLSFDEWMRLDLEYIDNWSLWLDLKIAVKTVGAVLVGRGAK